MAPLYRALVALIALLLPAVSYSGERNQIREVVGVDYVTTDPCTKDKVRIVGDVVLDGYYVDVEEGYRFRGEADYTDLVANSLTSSRVYRVRRSEDDRIRMTVDIPVERTIKHDALFRTDGKSFMAQFEFKFSVSFFGDKDIDLTAVRTSCRQSRARQDHRP
jgi:hypothetical protein